MTPEEVRKMKENSQIVHAAIHPDTGNIIPAFMRLSNLIPIQILALTSAGLLGPTQMISNFFPLYLLMQTQFAFINAGNGNDTTDSSKRGTLRKVLLIMAIASITRSFFVNRMSLLHGSKVMVGALASATVGAGNLLLMRFKEIA
jgi:hypothetical protein